MIFVFLYKDYTTRHFLLERRFCRIVSVDEMQFGFMPERGIIDAGFILRKLQEEWYANEKKLCVFCGPRESFWKSTEESVEWAMRKKGIQEVLVRSVMNLYDGGKTYKNIIMFVSTFLFYLCWANAKRWHLFLTNHLGGVVQH